MGEISLGNLYDFNKNAMSQVEPMDVIELSRKLISVADTMIDALDCYRHYWMLLCHELRNYTLFKLFL